MRDAIQLIFVLFLIRLAPVRAFVIIRRGGPVVTMFKTTTTTTPSSTALYWFFDKAFHGHGSSVTEYELDQIFKTQQEILKARKTHGETKEQLKLKYKKPPEHFNVKASQEYHADGTEMYIEKKEQNKDKRASSVAGKAAKMPWNK